MLVRHITVHKQLKPLAR